MRSLGNLGVERLLRTEYDFNNLEIAPGYPIARWQNDPGVNRDTILYFKRWATRAPYIRDEDDTKVQDIYGVSDFFHGADKKAARGLGAAFLLEALALSFSSAPCWNYSQVQLLFEHLRDDNFYSIPVDVKHSSSKEHIMVHQAWIKKYAKLDVQSGAELCKHRDTLYPSLQFCDSALQQLQALAYRDKHLSQVKRYLDNLNEYAEQWKTGPFLAENIKGTISGESSATLRNEKYAQKHTFLCPDGRNRLFSWHCKMTLDQWRLYFYPLEPGIILVGYVGAHMATVKFPT